MAQLVDAVLIAQGYTTYRSPEGPDKGIDILDALGPLGFGKPRMAPCGSKCIRVVLPDKPQLVLFHRDQQVPNSGQEGDPYDGPTLTPATQAFPENPPGQGSRSVT